MQDRSDLQLSFFDLHCDTATEMLATQQPLAQNQLAVSLEHASVYQQYIQVMAYWTDHRLSDEDGWERLLAVHQNLLADLSVTSGKAVICKDCPSKTGKASLLLGVEDARVLNNRLDRMDQLANMGIRILTPLWSGETCIGGSHNTKVGLTEFGVAAMKYAMSLRMIPDISHASQASADRIFDLAQSVSMPVIASHSNAYDVCPVSRNLRNDQIKAVIDSGGVIGLNLFCRFLKPDGEAEMADLIPHIEYFLEQGAERALCFGCDMDGAALPKDLQNLSMLPNLAQLMLRYYPESLVRAIFFDNAFHFAERHLALSAENP